MKIAIVGYGRMGKMVHSILSSSEEHSVTAIIDPESTDSDVTARKVCEETLSASDAVIEFSSPSAVLNNLEVYAHLQLPAVIGTTGWLDNLQEAENIAKGRNPVIYSGNFSLGVAVFLHLVSEAGKLGLTSGQPKVLDFLLKYQEADQKTIAAYCEIEQATVGSILLRMEKAGLVLRRNREGNRRSLYVSLTDKGQKAAEKMMDVFRREEEKAVSGLSTEEVDTLKNILLKLCGSIEQSSKEKRTEL